MVPEDLMAGLLAVLLPPTAPSPKRVRGPTALPTGPIGTDVIHQIVTADLHLGLNHETRRRRRPLEMPATMLKTTVRAITEGQVEVVEGR
jgi:hypothetical protein